MERKGGEKGGTAKRTKHKLYFLLDRMMSDINTPNQLGKLGQIHQSRTLKVKMILET